MQNQSSQWLNVRRDKPDWMMMFGWGALHPTALKEAAKVNYPDGPVHLAILGQRR